MFTRLELHAIASKECRNELTDYMAYKKLSRSEKSKNAKVVFSKLAEMEYVHYKFWRRYCHDKKHEPHWIKVRYVIMLRKMFGQAFMIKYLEGSESAAISKYGSLKRVIPEEDRKEFDKIISDEEEHERRLADQIRESSIRYISFVVLGLADALVEVAGIHAGSLGIYNSTLLTGLAGIIAGAAASLSMASAAYVQAKQGFAGSASTAAAYTGISYFIGAVILAFPYFVTRAALTAILSSLLLGMLMIAGVSWYNSIMSGSNPRREFSQIAGVMIGATALLFFVGFVIRRVFGIAI